MPRSEATSAITSHLWRHHGRTRASGTQTERILLHEEIHAVAANDAEIGHSHGPNGEFVFVCACGHTHNCTVLSNGG